MMPTVVDNGPDGVTLECSDCDSEVFLPRFADDSPYVSIVPLTDWTAPPLRCPECSDARESTLKDRADG